MAPSMPSALWSLIAVITITGCSATPFPTRFPTRFPTPFPNTFTNFPTPFPTSFRSENASSGAIVGGVVGGVFGSICLCAAIVGFCKACQANARRRQQNMLISQSANEVKLVQKSTTPRVYALQQRQRPLPVAMPVRNEAKVVLAPIVRNVPIAAPVVLQGVPPVVQPTASSSGTRQGVNTATPVAMPVVSPLASAPPASAPLASAPPAAGPRHNPPHDNYSSHPVDDFDKPPPSYQQDDDHLLNPD